MKAESIKSRVQKKIDSDISGWIFFMKGGNLHFYETNPKQDLIYQNEGKGFRDEEISEIARAIKDFSRNTNAKSPTPLFDILEIEKQIQKNDKCECHFFIGVSDYGIPTYCLVRHVGKDRDFVLMKQIHDKSDFEKEIEAISKIFNATIVRENFK